MTQFKTGGALTLVIAALAGAAGGAGATWALSRSAESSHSKSKPSAAPVADDVEDLSYRLDRLEADMRALSKRNQSSEALRQYAKALSGKKHEATDGAANEGAASDGKGAELDPVVDAEDPSFELAVRTVLDRVDWERQEEQRVTDEKRRQERAQRQTELLTERLKLSATQVPQVQQILTSQMALFRDLRNGDNRDAPRPESREDWRVRVEAIRSETEQQLSQVLDDKQMEGYRQFVEEQGFGQRGGRGRDDTGAVRP